MEKVQFSYRVEENFLKKLRINAVENNLSVSDMITKYVKMGQVLDEFLPFLRKNYGEKFDCVVLSDKLVEIEDSLRDI